MSPLRLARLQGFSLALPGSPGTAYGRKGRNNFSPGTGCPCKNSSPPGLLSPLYPREPRRHASHKARHRGGWGAKEDVMEAIDTRAKKGIRIYLERRGFEIQEGGGLGAQQRRRRLHPRDEDDLVFVHCQVTQNGGEGFPEEDADRAALERLAVAYLAEHLDFEGVQRSGSTS